MRLKDIREENELKQFTVGKLLGVSRRYLLFMGT